MGRKCFALGCKSGYATVQMAEGTSLHKFPKDEEVLAKWIRAIPQQD
jgi:hypothetical protein